MLPNKIDVVGINYEVNQVKDFIEEHGLAGQILYEKGIIKIDADMCQDKKEQIFVHEMLHAVFNESGYDKQDEDMINRLGIVLYQVLKNNNLYFGDAEEVEFIYDGNGKEISD